MFFENAELQRLVARGRHRRHSLESRNRRMLEFGGGLQQVITNSSGTEQNAVLLSIRLSGLMVFHVEEKKAN